MAIRIGPATEWMKWSADNSMSACRIRRTKGSASIAGLTGKRWMIVGMLRPTRMVCTRDNGRDIGTWPEMWSLARRVAGLRSLVVLRVAAAQALENPNGPDDVGNHTHPAIGAFWPRIVIPRLGLRIVEVIHDSPPELMIDARSVRPLASKRYSCKYVMVGSPT